MTRSKWHSLVLPDQLEDYMMLEIQHMGNLPLTHKLVSSLIDSLHSSSPVSASKPLSRADLLDNYTIKTPGFIVANDQIIPHGSLYDLQSHKWSKWHQIESNSNGELDNPYEPTPPWSDLELLYEGVNEATRVSGLN